MATLKKILKSFKAISFGRGLGSKYVALTLGRVHISVSLADKK